MAITRLSVDGYGARRSGSFAGKVESVAPPEVVAESLGANDRRYRYRGQILTRAEVEREYRKRAAETRRKAAENAKRDLQPPPAPIPDTAIGPVLDALDGAAKADAVDVARLMDDISARLSALPETTTDEDAEAMYVVMAAILLDDAS